MDLGPDLVEATFLKRLNRFAARVRVKDKDVLAHVANSGRMRELFVPGVRVLLKRKTGSHRKTGYDLCLVDLGFALVSADARLPNSLVAEALANGKLPQFAEYTQVKPESTYGESRLDFLLQDPLIVGPTGRCYLETKSVTLVESGAALFPDAPTSRGVKHMGSLVKAVEEGSRAAVIFVIQRGDARRFSPHDAADPDFAAAFRMALASGVEAYAYTCSVSLREVSLAGQIPIQIAELAVTGDGALQSKSD